MVEKQYEWTTGATLDDHSRRKHKILREYFFKYLVIRCQIPQQEKFRLAIIDGFCGGGRYKCGAVGSPLIFLEELKNAIDSVNIGRAANGLGSVEFECLLIFNDANRDAVETLKKHVAPIQAEIKENTRKLHLQIEYLNEEFESAYHASKSFLQKGRYRNVLFNLDQCGHSQVERTTLLDIMTSYKSAEIFYTFSIQSLVAFLRKADPTMLANQLNAIGLDPQNLKSLDEIMSRATWLGTAERIVFEAFRKTAPYVSPFSINNPDGWRYWLIHFANIYRARQVYNDILHQNSTEQAHYGRSGLNMLSYDPSHDENALYLFDLTGREKARNQLRDDIPRVISESGDAIQVGDFYEGIYNFTPAHTDDIHAALIENPDIEVITPSGGERRKANTIDVGDTLKLKPQRNFFSKLV